MDHAYNKMEELREAYESIPVPRALAEQMEALARRKRNSRRVLQYCRRAVGSVAAAALALVVAANAGPQVSAYLADIPVIGAFTQLVTFRDFREQQGTMEANIQTPHAVGLQDETLQALLNGRFDAYGEQLIEQYRQDVEDTMGGQAYMGVDSGYSLMLEDDRLLCVNIHTVLSAGSAQQIERYYVVDKQAGKILSLADLFQEDADYVGVLSKLVQGQMERQVQQDNEKAYDEDFSEISPTQPFYLNRAHELVLSFDQYEVAPGYMGAVTFTIPTGEIRSILKDGSPVGTVPGKTDGTP